VSDPYLDKEVAGQFRIVEKIGKGGMGAVYKAEQPDMNRYVAIKILHSRYLSRSDLVSRFRREARAMSQLSHPNTARVFLYGQLDDGACYFVMEHLVGQNLAQLVRSEGAMDAKRAMRIMIQVCSALEEAHQAGIVHRDLKPENIFVTTQGGIRDFPKVLDFGLAKVTERQMRPGSMVLTQQGMVFGTPEFMSPEQAHGKTLDARSDIYSLGIILYELLTGKLPFDARCRSGARKRRSHRGSKTCSWRRWPRSPRSDTRRRPTSLQRSIACCRRRLARAARSACPRRFQRCQRPCPSRLSNPFAVPGSRKPLGSC